MFHGNALQIMSENVHDGVQIDELIISHKSQDEVDEAEVLGLAHLATKLKVKTLRLWAGEFDDGVLDKLASTLEELGNMTLTTVDICDVTIPEPNDQIVHEGMNKIVERNKSS